MSDDQKAKRRALNRVNQTEHWLLERPTLTGWLLTGLIVVIIIWAIEAFA